MCGQEHLRLRALVEGLGQLLLDVPPHRGRQGSHSHCAAVAIAGGAVRVGTIPVDRVTDTTVVVCIAAAVARAFGHGTTARTMSTATVVRALAMRLSGQRIGVRIAVLVARPEVLVLFVAVVEVVVIVGMFVVAAAVHGLSVRMTVATVSVRVAATQVAFAAVVRVLMLMLVVGGRAGRRRVHDGDGGCGGYLRMATVAVVGRVVAAVVVLEGVLSAARETVDTQDHALQRVRTVLREPQSLLEQLHRHIEVYSKHIRSTIDE